MQMCVRQQHHLKLSLQNTQTLWILANQCSLAFFGSGDSYSPDGVNELVLYTNTEITQVSEFKAFI